MHWQVSVAKNNQPTLQVNGITIYSKYNPSEDAMRWIKSEVDTKANSYVLIGLGLGYHLKALSSLADNKPIRVYFFERQEYELFKTYNKDKWWQQPNITISHTLANVDFREGVQLLVPNVWIKAIGKEHPIYNLLDTIKINQQSYKRFAPLMKENFEENSKLKDFLSYPLKTNKIACLVASGPSLNETIYWLKKVNKFVDIYVVGSALKKLLAENINPKAVVISDAQDNIVKQLQGANFTGDLFYLSTANYKAVAMHQGSRYILCQQGYKEAEILAMQVNLPLIETGGSVATTAFSLIENLGYDSIVLFGQDLGYMGQKTHADASTSGKEVSQKSVSQIVANDGTMINTLPNLQVYLRWFENQVEKTPLNVYNTAKKGAKISTAPLINKQQFHQIINQSLEN